jgi:hypothetical protein
MVGRDSYERRIFKLVAYLGRYAHQPADVSLRLPMSRLRMLAEETDRIVTEENKAIERE